MAIKETVNSQQDKILEIFLKLADNDPELLPMLVQKTERLHIMMVIMAVCHLVEAGDQESARGYLKACKDDFLSTLDGNLHLNLAVNKLSLDKTHNERVAEEILDQIKRDT